MILLDKNKDPVLGVAKYQAPADWSAPCSYSECTFHQLSPYIGKLKSTIAAELIERYTNVGDLVLDPFSGSGTIPLECVIKGRNAMSADISPYSEALTLGKLHAPASLSLALDDLDKIWAQAQLKPQPDLRKVPVWVRGFFHPKTLKEILRTIEACKETKSHFILSCLLGIMHHQRPGFLSYPSSHLVPYLRDKKYPRESFSEMYEYREVLPRLRAKIIRTYKRPPPTSDEITNGQHLIRRIEDLDFPKKVDCLITSPPYMNMLDYSRDNRLRLWFLTGEKPGDKKQEAMNNKNNFINGIKILAEKTDRSLIQGGHAVLVVGDKSNLSNKQKPHEIVANIFSTYANKLKLKEVIRDNIPDIRRARRDCRGTKQEHILVFEKL